MAFVTQPATARLRSVEPRQEGCSDRGTTEGGHEPMITSVHSPNIKQLPG